MGGRVVVVGGSVAGLAAAAAVARSVDEVVIVERSSAEIEASVAPQGGLPHVMCAAGSVVLEGFFPGFHQALLEQGASGGADRTRMPVYWYAAGVARRHLVLRDHGFPRAMCGRRMIEPELRRRVHALPNVTPIHGAASSGIWSGSRLAAIELKDGARLDADLVVDATGRGGGFRAAAGITEPPATTVGVDIRYVGFVIERRPEDEELGELVLVQNTSAIPRIGGLLPLDGKRWQVLLGGYFGDGSPIDPSGAASFATSLADPALVPFLGRDYLEEPRRYAFRSSMRRHWSRVTTPGLVAIGDSVASLNPIYGQGMSSALLQAQALGDTVSRHGLGAHAERRITKKLSAVVDAPWTVATGGDLGYPRTEGKRPPAHRYVARYIEQVMRASATDDTVNATWTDVQQVLAGPATLFHPRIMKRVRGAQ